MYGQTILKSDIPSSQKEQSLKSKLNMFSTDVPTLLPAVL